MACNPCPRAAPPTQVEDKVAHMRHFHFVRKLPLHGTEQALILRFLQSQTLERQLSILSAVSVVSQA